MSGDSLTLTTSGGHHISEFVSDYEAIGQSAVQLQQTGEETLELHRFCGSIITDQVDVQDGISIEALRQMALTVGDSLDPLGRYFCNLAEAAWKYADACRIAGDATKHMKERQDNLVQSLSIIVNERASAEIIEQTTRGLDEDLTAHGELVRYSVLDTEGNLNETPNRVVLDGKKRDDALRFIETHLSGLETMQENIHARQDTQLRDFEAAHQDWESAAATFADELDGILGVLEDTDAENRVQRDGSIADFFGTLGAVSDVATVIPGLGLGGLAIGLIASLLEAGYQIKQANELYAENGDSVRVAEQQVSNQYGEAGMALLGLIPFADFVRKFGKSNADPDVELPDDDVDARNPQGGDRSPDSDAPEERKPDLPVDIGVDDAPIHRWVEDAEETNPDAEFDPNEPVDGIPDPPARQIPEVEEPGSSSGTDPVTLPVQEPEPEITVEVDGQEDESGTGIEVERG
ncbi:hypothetical protein [uncultured Agrococcus sp.]|uniref:hypothetical protein n=1 Tax=uncultured Agrococcus sp. TaxID=382258 RepID=UPI0025D6EA24|nr:hypothetical protein [uncultured Agrococcus sp.]